MVTVRIPVSLQKLTNEQSKVEVEGGTVESVVRTLESRYPGIADAILDESGKIRGYVNVFINDDNVRSLSGEATPVKDGDEVSIIPAIAGG